ncbi:MAG: hypothetical protein ACK5MN_02640 [Lachnospiraceae bacterium]
MKIKDLDDFLEDEEPVSGFFILDKNEEYQEIDEENYIHIV